MNSPVSKLKEGNTGRIANFTDEVAARKLLTMGFLPGSQVKIVRFAPFQGGVYVQVNGSNMALRMNEADSIILEAILEVSHLETPKNFAAERNVFIKFFENLSLW